MYSLKTLFVFVFVVLLANSIYAQKKELGLNYLLQEKEYKGVILLYDYEKDDLFASHINKTDERVLPASTFKIFNTLIFLDLGIAKDTNTMLKWDGTEYKHKGKVIKSWNRDTRLADAFRNSTVWYYKEMSESVDFTVYKKLMKKNKYGKVYGRDKNELDFWNIGSKIGVNARDQIKFLVKLKDYNLTFKKEDIDVVKELMIVEQTDEYTFRAKSGWTTSPGSRFKEGIDLGWYVGYVEYDDNSYFFAIRLEKEVDEKRPEFAQDRIDIAKKALSHQFGLEFKD